ncbi:16S rRNA (guanine(527)-N(7))-methyltransferase RsmG [Mesorhizobium sp. KR9-304]|uniref:16S rRNA (guanine(527)-N(7))-methyltransferase RsmG n=1 Tax=Mesorhizobium sp. KR9-304 TaxID=3156614 RepID=UPI0032B4ACBD
MTNSDKYQSLIHIAGPVSRETFEGLEAFEAMFRTWASRINLAAPSTLDDLWNRHILDSAQLAPLAPNALRWLDLGSGGGFPGLVLAFLLKDRPGGHIDLVESNRKKAGFLQAAVGEFALPARIHASRIGPGIKGLQPPDIVTARALAPLPELLDLAFPWLSVGATGLLHKGRDYGREVQESALLWQYDLIEHLSRVDTGGVILEIANLKRR